MACGPPTDQTSPLAIRQRAFFLTVQSRPALGGAAANRNLTRGKMREWREHKKPKAVQVEFFVIVPRGTMCKTQRNKTS